MSEQQPAALTVGEVLAQMRGYATIAHRMHEVYQSRWHGQVSVDGADLTAWIAALAQVEGVLRQFVGQEWMPWGYDDERQQWGCCFCGAMLSAEHPVHDPPAHADACPVLVARRLLAARGGQ